MHTDVYQRADLKHIATFSTFAPSEQTWPFNGSCTTGQDRCVCACVCVCVSLCVCVCVCVCVYVLS